ncbi:MAG: DUF4174 domain-containing protein [Algibacter sp.]|uniref:DUF4174 domain-containing protein n=1 Tax=Algibacter sp. TaxID=1872428 RepID=UPI00260E4C36|nr:DUF4174 domain-containing protein [Algibacter sp.]MDG1728844.1 DUF4174 domain-containing protein [Algibacter sp.]MDG2179788.1 DUF4174 domain-containing protein [Algibacter sp.]
MKIFKILFFIISIINVTKGMSQNIASHQWKNRVLLIITDDSDSITFQNQIKTLQTHENGLTDRKLIVYQIKKHSYTTGLKDEEWKDSSKLYKIFKTANTPFEVILIGLDGGIKLRQSDLLTCEALFSTIDVMPMRKEALKRKNK